MEQIEGLIGVEAALTARQRKISLIIIRTGKQPATIENLIRQAESQQVPVKFVSREEIEAMAQGKTHGGVLALCSPKPPLPIEALLEKIKLNRSSPALLLLEGVDDSQNLGFTLRTAEACGLLAVVLKKHLWNFDSTTVSRASSGAFERLPIVMLDQAEKALRQFKQVGISIYGCLANARRTIFEVDLRQPVMIAIGGEKRGLSAAVRSCCDSFLSIPLVTNIGSLSLSQAAAIIMAEIMRQRLQQ